MAVGVGFALAMGRWWLSNAPRWKRSKRPKRTSRGRRRTTVTVPSPFVGLVVSIIRFIRNDLGKILRFAMVSVFTVPLGMTLFWLFLQTDLAPPVANMIAVTITTIPNYLLNRYWVWRKMGTSGIGREIGPFWAIAFLGFLISTLFVWVAGRFTDNDLVFLAGNFIAYGMLWVLKFFVLEKYLFADAQEPAPTPA